MAKCVLSVFLCDSTIKTLEETETPTELNRPVPLWLFWIRCLRPCHGYVTPLTSGDVFLNSGVLALHVLATRFSGLRPPDSDAVDGYVSTEAAIAWWRGSSSGAPPEACGPST